MRIRHGWWRAGKALLIGSAALACVATTAAVAQAQGPAALAGSPAALPSASRHLCRAHNRKLADRLSRDILSALKGRHDIVGVRVDDPHLGVNCYYNSGGHFYSASAVKATILAALLYKDRSPRKLTAYEKSEAWRMITQSDNKAASYLWGVVSPYLHTFLRKAHMRHTEPSFAWGLTRITAHDETLLLWLLMKHNHVLTNSARKYELNLMAHVVPGERWGVSAGAPTNFTVHLKNGWAPLPNLTSSQWVINSIGAFTRGNGKRDYSMVVLTSRNGTGATGEDYGIATIQAVAVRVNRDLTPTSHHAAPVRQAYPSTPDETLPPRPSHG